MTAAHAPRSPEDVRSFFAVWTGSANAGDWDAYEGLLDPDVVVHDPMDPEPARGRVAALARVRKQYEPFPDGRIEVVGEPFTAVDGSELAYRWRFTGTHLNAIDPPGFAATGQRVMLDGASVLRFRDRTVIEATLFFDTTDAARQVLAAPPAGSPLELGIVLLQRLRAGMRRRRR